MIVLTGWEAVRNAIERCSQLAPIGILKRYAAMLETEPLAWLFIVQPGDTAEDLAKLRGQPFSTWEFIELTEGWYETVFIISDDGFGHVVLIPDQPNVDAQLLSLCRQNASKAQGAGDINT